MRAIDVVRLREIVLHETLHIGEAPIALLPAVDLQIDAGKMVVGVRVELALELSVGLDFYGRALGVGIGFVSGEAVDLGVFLHQPAQHVVEGAVFHHQDDDVLEVVESGRRHTPSPSRRSQEWLFFLG